VRPETAGSSGCGGKYFLKKKENKKEKKKEKKEKK
jgi:hypothetical protein